MSSRGIRTCDYDQESGHCNHDERHYEGYTPCGMWRKVPIKERPPGEKEDSTIDVERVEDGN